MARKLRPGVVLAALALILGAGVPAARAQAPPAAAPGIVLDTGVRGWVGVTLTGQPGQLVTVSELLPAGPEPIATVTLGSDGTRTTGRLLPWRCDRFTRTLQASTSSDSTSRAAVTTPSCRRRLKIAKVTGRAGRGLTVDVTDTFGTGDLSAEVCAAPGRTTGPCATFGLPAGHPERTVHVPADRPGRYQLHLRTAYAQDTTVARLVRRAPGTFRLLAAGDSMMQVVDSRLAARLKRRGGQVTSDAHVSTGITKPFALDWPAHAAASARRLRPDVTVVFLGANDGFNLPGPGGKVAGCCYGSWVDEYARRAQAMMRSYLRDGRGRVYWMVLPTPRTATFRKVFRGVNAGIRQAAAAFDASQVKLVDLGATFTPGGRFRPRHRQADGVHLDASGASIAADLIIAALRNDGYVG